MENPKRESLIEKIGEGAYRVKNAGAVVTARDIAKMIDVSLLKTEMPIDLVKAGCEVAAKYEAASVCVKPCDVKLSADLLQGTDVIPTTVIGFPHGHHVTDVKLKESEIAIKDGARELDMVMNVGWFKSGLYDEVQKDIRAVCELAHAEGAIVKVIFENCYLTKEEIEIASRISDEAGADYLKTSTGYASGGAKIIDLDIMYQASSPRVLLKAAGGVRSLESALAVRSIGVSRFGCTRTEEIMEDARNAESAGTLVLPETIQEL